MDMDLKIVDIEKPPELNVIIGHSHFIKTVEDLYEILATSIPGIKFIDFDRSRERSLCCEGGGGRMWVEGTDTGERLSGIRIKDAVDMGVDIVATACPFCLLTLEDAVKTAGFDGKIEIKDIMELVAQTI